MKMELKQRDALSHNGGHAVMPSMGRRESFSGSGTVFIRQFKMVDGEKVYLDEPPFRKNLIVEKGRSSLIDLLVGAEQKKLSFIRWGKGGAPSFPQGDPLEPFAVDDADTDVATPLIDKPLSAYLRNSPTELEYIETLICDEVNNDVNEAAMLFENTFSGERSIFARITFPTIRLTVEKGTGIELRWIFNFSKSEEQAVQN
jgi:hypothetical protein